MYIRDPEVLTPREPRLQCQFFHSFINDYYLHTTLQLCGKFKYEFLDREEKGWEEGEGKNELYSIHYLVKDILRKTVSELPFFLGKESLFIEKLKK